MIGDTLSPARAGPRHMVVGIARRQRLDPGLAHVGAADDAIEQIEGLGDHVIARHQLEFRRVDAGEQSAQPQGFHVGAPPGRTSRASRVSKTIVPPFFI